MRKQVGPSDSASISPNALRKTPAVAALYAGFSLLMLYDLEKRGWIAGRWEANHAGRDRRYDCFTAAGKKDLVPLRREWNFSLA
ncbi:MAG TPA: PadR family transcriptional regulator [Terriglobales bacterium]